MLLDELLKINKLVFGVNLPKIRCVVGQLDFSSIDRQVFNYFIYTGCKCEIKYTYTDLYNAQQTFTENFSDYFNLYDLTKHFSGVDLTQPFSIDYIKPLDYKNNAVLDFRYYLLIYDFSRIMNC